MNNNWCHSLPNHTTVVQLFVAQNGLLMLYIMLPTKPYGCGTVVHYMYNNWHDLLILHTRLAMKPQQLWYGHSMHGQYLLIFHIRPC